MGKRNKTYESAMINSNIYKSYLNRLISLGIAMFEWVNLPPSIDERYLETILLNQGQIVWFEDDVLGLTALNCTLNGGFSVYNVPIKRIAYASNGYHNDTLNESNSVLMYNNVIRTNSMSDILMYAEKLYNLERTLDTNIMAQKTPIIVTCNERQRTTMVNALMQYEGNEPFIYGDNNLDVSTAIKSINTQAPFIADKLQALKTQLWNEALTTLGIANMNINKKERLLADEVDLNSGSFIAQQYVRLNPRKQACKQINEMFDTNIDVKFRNDVLLENDGGETE